LDEVSWRLKKSEGALVAITNGYASLNQVKAALRITDTVDDSLLEMAVESASRLIDGYCGRSFFSQGSAIRFYAPDNPYLVQVDDLSSGTVTVRTSSAADGNFDVTWGALDIQLEPLNGRTEGQAWPFTRIRAVGDYLWPSDEYGEATVQLTATYGWPGGIPINVTQAAIIQASRIFKRLDSPLGVAGFGDMGAIRVGRGLDPDVAQLVEPYRKMTGVG
jgi:hypothetical protein